jgi:ankyrin repeat protein
MKLIRQCRTPVVFLAITAIALSGCSLLGSAPYSTKDYQAIHAAAEEGDLPTVKGLIDVHPKLLEARDWRRFTPLQLAAYHGHTDVVAYLASKGANINATNQDGLTALHLAALSGFTDTVIALLSHGAEINARDADGLTPLDRASQRHHPDIVELLRQRGGHQ